MRRWTGHMSILLYEAEVTPRSLSPYFLGIEIKIVATICQILRLKFTQFYVGWGFATYPARGVYSTPQTHSWI